MERPTGRTTLSPWPWSARLAWVGGWSIKAGRARLIPLTAVDEFLSADEEFAA